MLEEIIGALTEYVQAAQANAAATGADKELAQAREDVASTRFKEVLEDAIGAFGALLEQMGPQVKEMIERFTADMAKK